MRGGWRWLLLAACLPLLAACENSATSYSIDGSHHALILVREQPYFWTSEVNQFFIVSRLPSCQRRVAIPPDVKKLTPIEIFEAGDRLWAARQGDRWLLAGTERCLVQDWQNPDGRAPGPLVGSFRLESGKPSFVPAEGNESP